MPQSTLTRLLGPALLLLFLCPTSIWAQQVVPEQRSDLEKPTDEVSENPIDERIERPTDKPIDTPERPRVDGATPATQALSGTLRLVEADGTALTEIVDLSEAVVYFNPEVPVEVEAPAEAVTLTTARRQFVPRVIVVEAGSVVRFPNDDPILHNVFSSSPGNRFDLGLYGESDGLTHRFDQPGLVRVFCNVHSRMSAHIVVVDTPFYLRPDGEGRFRFEAVPRGAGTLTAWHERSDPLQIPVNVGSEDLSLEPIELRATVRQIAPQRERLRRRRRRY